MPLQARPSVRMQLLSTGKGVGSRHVAPGDPVRCASEVAHAGSRCAAESLERRSRTSAAARVARLRLAFRLSLRCSSKDEREYLFFQVPLLVEMCPADHLSRGGSRETPGTHTASSSIANPRYQGVHDSPVMRDQEATQDPGQMFTPLGVAAQPEEMLGGPAGQVAAKSPRCNFHRQIARDGAG